MTWYRSGTVAVTNNSKTVTGTGTGWSALASFSLVGSAFRGPDGRVYEIEAINGGTSLSLVEAYLGATANGQTYALMPTLGLAADLATAVSQLTQRTASTVDTATATGKALLAAPTVQDARTTLNVEGVITEMVGGVWTSAALPIASASGALSNANATVRYKKVGRTVFFTATINIISNGSGGAAIRANLPFYAAADTAFAGRENAQSGAQLQGLLAAGANTVFLFRYDNAYPGGDNRILTFSGVYEAIARVPPS